MQAGSASLSPLLDVTLSSWLLDARRTSGSWQQPAGDELLWQCFSALCGGHSLHRLCIGPLWGWELALGRYQDWPSRSPPTLLPAPNILTLVCVSVPPASDPTHGVGIQGVARFREADWKHIVTEGDG